MRIWPGNSQNIWIFVNHSQIEQVKHLDLRILKAHVLRQLIYLLFETNLKLERNFRTVPDFRRALTQTFITRAITLKVGRPRSSPYHTSAKLAAFWVNYETNRGICEINQTNKVES